MARIMRQGEKYHKNFPLSKYKTWPAAEREARKWVDQMLKKLPPRASRRGQPSDRNESGVVGVWAVIDKHTVNGKTYEYCRWGARWPDCPVRGGLRLSVNKWGDNDAFVMACLAVKHEKADRKWLERRLKKIKGTAEYRNWLKMKRVEFV